MPDNNQTQKENFHYIDAIKNIPKINVDQKSQYFHLGAKNCISKVGQIFFLCSKKPRKKLWPKIFIQKNFV